MARLTPSPQSQKARNVWWSWASSTQQYSPGCHLLLTCQPYGPPHLLDGIVGTYLKTNLPLPTKVNLFSFLVQGCGLLITPDLLHDNWCLVVASAWLSPYSNQVSTCWSQVCSGVPSSEDLQQVLRHHSSPFSLFWLFSSFRVMDPWVHKDFVLLVGGRTFSLTPLDCSPPFFGLVFWFTDFPFSTFFSLLFMFFAFYHKCIALLIDIPDRSARWSC